VIIDSELEVLLAIVVGINVTASEVANVPVEIRLEESTAVVVAVFKVVSFQVWLEELAVAAAPVVVVVLVQVWLEKSAVVKVVRSEV
jgi:hypothetical protein